jgi:hypothetical protein
MPPWSTIDYRKWCSGRALIHGSDLAGGVVERIVAGLASLRGLFEDILYIPSCRTWPRCTDVNAFELHPALERPFHDSHQ